VACGSLLAFLKRKLLRKDRDPEVSEEATAAQREAIGKYIAPAESILELIVYPDANHGSFYQYPQLFVSDADQFLTSALQGDDAKLQSPERLPFPSIVSAFSWAG
jgi:hypothetical protein